MTSIIHFVRAKRPRPPTSIPLVLGRVCGAIFLLVVGFPVDAWSQASRPTPNVHEAIALNEIKLVAGAPVTVALVGEKNCRLHGKVEFRKPIDIDKPRVVVNGGWQLSFTSKSCAQSDGVVHRWPFVGALDLPLPVALKAGDPVAVTGIEHPR